MSDQRTMRGAIAVPAPLLVTKDALGSTIPAEIGGVELNVLLPVPIKDKESPTPLKPPPGYEQFLDLPGRNDPSILGWGSVMGYEPSVWGVRVVAVSFSVGSEGPLWSAPEWKRIKDAFGE